MKSDSVTTYGMAVKLVSISVFSMIFKSRKTTPREGRLEAINLDCLFYLVFVSASLSYQAVVYKQLRLENKSFFNCCKCLQYYNRNM